MLRFLNKKLEKEFHDPRQFDWRMRLILIFIGEVFYLKFGKRLVITCLGRKYNPGSAHYEGDKIDCGADARSRDLTLRELIWLSNKNVVTNPYMDIIIEDDRLGRTPPGGAHIHFEFNKPYWMKFIREGMI